MKTLCIVLALFFATSLISLPAAEKRKAESNEKRQPAPAKVSWKISGDLEEACSCSAACPCWFASKPTKMTCDGVQVLFIKKGSYGRTKLDGLAIGNVVQSPEGEAMMDSVGRWNFSYLYLDERATPEQRVALEAIGRTVLPIATSKNVVVRDTAITRRIEGPDHHIALGKYGNFRGRLVAGGLGGAPKIVNPPGADPIHKEYLQGQNASFVYRDAGKTWNHKGSNYMQAKFNVNSSEYAKYTAGLAQKMGKKG